MHDCLRHPRATPRPSVREQRQPTPTEIDHADVQEQKDRCTPRPRQRSRSPTPATVHIRRPRRWPGARISVAKTELTDLPLIGVYRHGRRIRPTTDSVISVEDQFRISNSPPSPGPPHVSGWAGENSEFRIPNSYLGCQPSRINASISSVLTGSSADRFSAPSSVIRKSFSILTPSFSSGI